MNKKRQSLTEVERVVGEYERSGLTRQQFSSTHGLKIYILDGWRRRVAQSRSSARIVPVELVSDPVASSPTRIKPVAKQNMAMRVVLTSGVRVEVEPGFDAAELRRLIATLDAGREAMSWME